MTQNNTMEPANTANFVKRIINSTKTTRRHPGRSNNHQFVNANLHQTGLHNVLKINDTVTRLDGIPSIEINLNPMMKGKWLFDTGAGLTCTII
jgi:hypothetical protein